LSSVFRLLSLAGKLKLELKTDSLAQTFNRPHLQGAGDLPGAALELISIGNE